ncbi:unnamed protein product, partial [Candidula unifasciata]
NKTVLGLIFRDDKELVEMFTFTVNIFFIPLCAFVIIAICTAILSSQLHTNSQWRKTTVIASQGHKITIRNKKVAKMVVSIFTLFISCFVPTAIIMLAMALVPDIMIGGKYFNASKIMCGCIFILEGINSSVNIFIYYNMSTKYRQAFHTMFIIGNVHTT